MVQHTPPVSRVEELGLLTKVQELGLPSHLPHHHHNPTQPNPFHTIPSPPRVEELGLLTKVQELGLLSKLEQSGLTLSKIEESGLLAKLESSGLLKVVADK